MATTFFFRDTASDVSTADVDKLLSLTRGASAVSKVTNTAAGPVNPASTPVPVTDGAGGTTISWFTNPLDAVTISITSATNPTANLRGLESAAQANACLQIQVDEVDGSGTVVQNVWTSISPTRTELSTSETAQNFLPTSGDNGSGNSPNITAGNRLRFRVLLDDATGVTMASGRTVTFFYDGLSAATGDSFVTFTETITEQTAAVQVPYVNPLPPLLAQ